MNRSILAAMAVSIAFSFVGVACNDGEPDTSGSGGDAGGTSLGGDTGNGGSGPSCGSSQETCDGICTNLKSDPAHCGDCATLCGAGQGCSDGKCQRFGCFTGQVECPMSGCVSLQTDPANCGECDIKCAQGERCTNGACAVSCPGGLVACSGTCIDPQTNRDFCGARACDGAGSGGLGGNSGDSFGEKCEADELCIEGACQVGCSQGQLVCGGACIDPETSPLFCGATDCSLTDGEGVACESGQACVAGVCQTSCPGAQLVCDGACINPSTDREHCGATDCGVEESSGEACEEGQVCVLGACATSCPAGQIVCAGKCIDPDTDANHCGATDCNAVPTSGVDCGSGEVCVTGSCATSCPPGQQACGASGSEQCVDPTRDREYCGATDCSTGANGEVCSDGEVCSNSACVTSCPTGELECNGKCIDPSTDLDFCGATDCTDGDAGDGTSCDSGNVCSAGQCTVSCVEGQINCGGKCVDPDTDNQYCGASGNCSGGNVGTACTSGNVCADGDCAASCPSGQLECNGSCVDPLTSSALCGASDCTGTGGEVCGTGQTCVIGECRAFLREWGLGERVDVAAPPVSTEEALAADADGDAVVVFRQQLVNEVSDATLRPFASFYSAATKTWATPIQLDTRAFRVRNLQVDLNDSGIAVAVWTRDDASQSFIVMSRYNGTAWSTPVDIAGTRAETPAVFVDAAGRALIVYSLDGDGNSGTFDSQAMGVTVSATGVLGTPVALSDLSGANYAAYLPRIAGNADGEAMVVYYNGLAPRNIYAIHYDPVLGFQAASSKVQLNSAFSAPFNRASGPQVSMDAAGNAHAVWHQTSGGYAPPTTLPASAAIFHAYYDATAGTWGTATQVTSFTTPEAAVDPRIATNAAGTTSLTYQVYNTTPSTAYSVYAHRWSGGAWIAAQTIATAIYAPALPTVVVSGSGDTHVAWAAGNAVRTRRYVAASDLWTGAETLNTNQSSLAQAPVMDATSGVNVFYGWLESESTAGYHLFVARFD